MGINYLLFGIVFGIAYGKGADDGNLILFCRICRKYYAGDVVLLKNGESVEYDKKAGGLVAGKIVAELKVRNFKNGKN